VERAGRCRRDFCLLFCGHRIYLAKEGSALVTQTVFRHGRPAIGDDGVSPASANRFRQNPDSYCRGG